MPTYLYILIPLAVLVIGLLWKFRQVGQGESSTASSSSSTSAPRPSGIAGVQQLIAEGKKIEAIKLMTETTGIGLKAAKDAVELMEKGHTVTVTNPLQNQTQPVSPSSADADPEVLRLVQERNLIGAIKRYRELTGLGLKESKDAVERLTGR